MDPVSISKPSTSGLDVLDVSAHVLFRELKCMATALWGQPQGSPVRPDSQYSHRFGSSLILLSCFVDLILTRICSDIQ